MNEKMFIIVYRWFDLVYTIRDDGSNSSVYTSNEADEIINEWNCRIEKECATGVAGMVKIELPNDWIDDGNIKKNF